ncbi:DUF1684 domain-containing protein [Phycicoccus sp. 3266]|uniref:DUF1684 domain-containing protein n=1 Tax=Phycicoccus sp. 3266 TaxID=2817751 RepID=UPI00285FEEF6|nr:DUF1684 domain-containing protein [Phycicoccus sp. 3266]MDR6862015.1 uncharacterized protein (DUF1684 family) [Phycicoccus sp. 3266]
MTAVDDDLTYPPPLQVASWRREVHSLYAAVRAERDPAAAHALWVEGRTELFETHPASPRRPGQRMRHAAYDPSFRFTVPVVPAELDGWKFTTGTDGVVPFSGIGTVALGDLGEVAVWWLDSYGGGVFLPLRDGSAGSETYGAGRYVLDTVKGSDLGRDGDAWVVDLNFAYNPSCVYDYRWVCPLAPPANRIASATPVGELLPEGYDA